MTEAAMMALHPLRAGHVLDGRFRIVRELGRGGMGVVYEVEHVLTGHRRALKLLAAGSAESICRVVREASAAARIRSTHVVETIDAGLLADGEAYILMELLEGESWATCMKRSGPLAAVDACRLGAQACAGLAAAHRVGIVHRDVKPANLFVVGDPAAPVVKIIDFGISRFDPVLTDATDLTADGIVVGTPHYMAPEQLRGLRDLDGRADVYALGVVLYLVLTGQHPYRASSVAELAVQVLRGEQVPLRTIRPDVGEELAALLHGAMSTDAARRPDAETFGRLLRAHAGVGEEPVGVGRAPSRPGWRRWSMAAAALGIGVASVAGVAGIAGRRRAPAVDHAGVGIVGDQPLRAEIPAVSGTPPSVVVADPAPAPLAPPPAETATTRAAPAPPRPREALDRRNPYGSGAR